MNLTLLDWLIVGGLFAAIGLLAMLTRRYSQSVSDFLTGNRCAGRYLLTVSEGMASMGLVGIVANFEKFFNAGFVASWWGLMMSPIALIIALSGWVRYRYRETRAMTMAQFFEMRYSRRFRIFAGIVAWVSGILNFGIFCAAMIAGSIGNDTTYMHAQGSIFIQDVILPFRKIHLSPAQHLRLLRWSIVGAYAIDNEHAKPKTAHPLQWLGINEEFSFDDRLIYFAKIAWTAFWFAAFSIGTVLGLTVGISQQNWARWWHFSVILGVIVGVITVVWFLTGGMIDLAALVRTLRTAKRDPNDDGSVPHPIAVELVQARKQ